MHSRKEYIKRTPVFENGRHRQALCVCRFYRVQLVIKMYYNYGVAASQKRTTLLRNSLTKCKIQLAIKNVLRPGLGHGI